MFSSFKFSESGSSDDKGYPSSSTQASDEQLCPSEKNNALIRERALERKNMDKPDASPKRSFANVMTDLFRRTSDTSHANSSNPPSRKASGHNMSARSVGNALGLFQSHNPDTDSADACSRPRKHSTHSSNSVDDLPAVTPEGSRRPSYMPRNATAAFIKTANGTSEDHPQTQAEPTGPRKASIMGVMPGGDSPKTVLSGRRPSGIMPNNVSARYIRSKSMNEEEKFDSTRRGSARSRQHSANDVAVIKSIPMQSDQFQHWQNSVNRHAHRNPFPAPITPQTRPIKTNGNKDIDDVKEDFEGESSDEAMTGVKTHVAISIVPASPDRVVTGVTVNGHRVHRPQRLSDQVSPTNRTFGSDVGRDLSDIREIESRPETPLESLGFRGAVPA